MNTSLGSITIPADETSATGTLELTPTDDTGGGGGTRRIVVSGTTTTPVGLDVSDATITLTDDDKTTADPGDEDDRDSAEISISGPTSANVNGGRRRDVYGDAVGSYRQAGAGGVERRRCRTDAAEASDLSAARLGR